MNIILFFLLVTLFVQVTFVYFILFNNIKKSFSLFSVLLVLLVCFLWGLAFVGLYIISLEILNEILLKLVHFFPMFIPPFLFLVYESLNNKDIRILFILNFFFLSFVSYLLFINGSIVSNPILKDGYISYKVLDDYLYYMIYYFTLIPINIFIFARESCLSNITLTKEQNKFMAIAIAVSASLSFLCNLVAPYFGNFSLNGIGQISINIWILTVMYTISRYKLIALQSRIEKIILFIQDIFLLSLILVLTLFVIQNVIHVPLKDPVSLSFYISFAAFMVVIYYQLLRMKIFGFIIEVFFPSISTINKLDKWIKNNYQYRINSFVNTFVSMLQKSLEISEIKYYFKINKVPILHNLDKKTQIGEYVSARLHIIIDHLLENYSTHNIIDTYDFDDDPVLKRLREKGVGLIAFFVLRRHNNVGIIFLENKKHDAYTEYEKKLLEDFIDQLSIKIDAYLMYKLFNIYSMTHVKTISKLRIIQRELKELKSKKEEKEENRKDQNTDKLSIIGHELKTPLTVARGNMEFLYDKVMNATSNTEIELDYLKKKLDKIYKSISKEIDLVQTLLSSGHVENEKMNFQFTTFNFLDVVDYSYELFYEDAVRKGLYMNFEKPADYENYIVYSDQSRLTEITNNLVSNAVKYTDKGGIDILVSQDGEMIIFKVKDTGRGIPKHLLHKIGQKYYRIDQYGRGNDDINVVRSGGTGLGIYVIKNILNAIGGRLNVLSEYGVGSTFTAYIPKDVPNYIASKIHDLGFITTNPLAVKMYNDIKIYIRQPEL